MQNTKVFTMPFAKVYPLYISKVEKKWRTKAELDIFDDYNSIKEA